MTYSLQFLRQFMRGWQAEAGTTRIFFPDQKAGPARGMGAGVERRGRQGATHRVAAARLHANQ